jgi:lactate permease
MPQVQGCCCAVAGLLGAVGSFVSGSVMGSNMTQGAIQASAAERLEVPVTSVLAVQVAGACAGKMVCASSILVSKIRMAI